MTHLANANTHRGESFLATTPRALTAPQRASVHTVYKYAYCILAQEQQLHQQRARYRSAHPQHITCAHTHGGEKSAVVVERRASGKHCGEQQQPRLYSLIYTHSLSLFLWRSCGGSCASGTRNRWGTILRSLVYYTTFAWLFSRERGMRARCDCTRLRAVCIRYI